MSRRFLLAICALAALARVGAFIALDRFHQPEVWESETVATNLIEGRGFTYPVLGTEYRSYMEPLYPALCAVVYRFTGHSFLALGLIQVGLGVALVWLVFACARRVVPEGAALIAALLTALHPALVLYTTTFHPFVLDSTLWFAAFAVVLAFAPDRPWRSVIAAGTVIGLCVLTRPTILACVPVMAWWIWVRSADTRRVKALLSVTLVVCAGLVVSPWVWRNYQVHQRFILTRSGTSFVFWLGNNSYVFTGSAMMPDGRDIISSVPAAVQQTLRRFDELGQQDYFRDDALLFVRSHPGEFLRRWLVKLGYFWWFSPQTGLLYPPLWTRLFRVFYAALLALTILGLWTTWRQTAVGSVERRAAMLIIGCCLSVSLLQSLYYVEGRHRLAIEPFLLIFAGATLWRTVQTVTALD